MDMEKKKTLMVNCSVCDVRNISEEVLSAYDKVRINCALLLTSPQANVLMARYGVSSNSAGVSEAEGEAAVVNGRLVLRPGQLPGKNAFLVVNGKLEAEPGAEDAVRAYTGIQVNGKVVCPESMAGLFAGAGINGRVETYPDGAIRLEAAALLDRTFPLRAKEGALYYVRRKAVALDGALDGGRLAEKGVRFTAGELVVCEALAEQLVPLFDERCGITVVPDGTAFVPDDAVLDETLMKRYGTKLYVDGSLTITSRSAAALDKLEFLQADGAIRVTRSMKEAVAGRDFKYEEIEVIAGITVADREETVISNDLLSEAGEGLGVEDCATVRVHPQVTAGLLREKLVRLADCGRVWCTEEQYAPLSRLAEDVGEIIPCDSPLTAWKDEAGEEGDGGAEKVVINASSYVF